MRRVGSSLRLQRWIDAPCDDVWNVAVDPEKSPVGGDCVRVTVDPHNVHHNGHAPKGDASAGTIKDMSECPLKWFETKGAMITRVDVNSLHPGLLRRCRIQRSDGKEAVHQVLVRPEGHRTEILVELAMKPINKGLWRHLSFLADPSPPLWLQHAGEHYVHAIVKALQRA